MKILFLTAWYPYRYDKMAGLFVQKHAEAVALTCEVKLIYVHADDTIQHIEKQINTSKNLTEILIYYPINKKNPFYKIFKIFNFLRAYLVGFTTLRSLHFKPDLVHVNVLTRTAVIALLIKILKGIPYVITEHWTRYLPGRASFKGTFRKILTRVVVHYASAVMPVSKMLKEGMLHYKLYNRHYEIVDNVIDPAFLTTYPIQTRAKKRMILVSCFLEIAKNVSGIIRTISKLSKVRDDFELIILGTGLNFDEIYQLSTTLNLTDKYVFFKGEKTSQEVAEWIYNSDFMILFSNYETAGVVITESLALGKPLLTTRVGIAEEYITAQEGVIIEVGDEEALLEKMNYMLDNIATFDNEIIHQKYRDRFSYEVIGQKITSLYDKVLNSQNS